MKKLSILFIAVILFNSSFAQLAKVTGSVHDPNEDKPVQNAVISLLTPKDSILYKFTRTNAAGKFTLNNVQPGKYILMTTHPYFADLLDNIDVKNTMEIPELSLISKTKLLQEVIVKTGEGFRIKGDTTIYTADSFKVSANANVEELLKKLPGIQVDKNGKITAMGQTVQKVLVDGEEFFGDDPGMAVKNLRADAVKEVQVFDKKSDQSEFTGIDDGKTQKTINLKLKDNSKHGYFGKVDLSGGSVENKENRYNENLMASAFKGKRKMAAYFLTGNTGQDGLNWEDRSKYGSGSTDLDLSIDDNGQFDVQWNGSSDDEPYVDPQNGFITNVNAGMLYSNKWNDKYKLNLTPSYQAQNYINHKQTLTQTQIGDSTLNGNTNEVDHVNRYNFQIRGVADIKIDSNNSFKITANENFYHTQSEKALNSITTGADSVFKNTSSSDIKTNSDKNVSYGNFIFRHKFAKLRRTLSVSGSWNVLNNTGTDYLQSFNQSYSAGIPAGNVNLNQMKLYNTNTSSLGGKIVYTEPLSKELSMQLGYELDYIHGNSNQLTYSYTPYTSKYDELVDSLSNQFKQKIIQNIPSAKLNFANKKLKLNIGSGFGFTNFDLTDVTFGKDYLRNYVNFYPTANAEYTYKPNKSIRFNYSGTTIQPTVNQLQPLRNNTDYYNQVIGNPNLKPAFTNNFSASHNSYNFLKEFGIYEYLQATTTSNAITYNRVVNLDSGKTVSQAINTDGNISLSFYSGINFKIKKIDTRIYLGPQLSYNRYASVINSIKSFSTSVSPGFSAYINKAKEKKYDFGINENINYNSSSTTQSKTKIHYITNMVNFNGTIYYKKVWSLILDLQNYYRQKTFASDNTLTTNLWNVKFQRTFKNNEFTAYIYLHDLFNDNIGIDRNFYGNTYTQVTNDRLKRYLMIGFRWDFKNKTSAAK
ncbi:MAG: TonB-dependent receptor family protein [Bacteroidota bacterium]|nr:TonB-dependent receptor family protein [Bacteroidota bacterium]